MSFYGLSTLQKINSKSASKWFGTAKIGEYLNIDVLVVVIVDPRKNTVRVYRQDGSVIAVADSAPLEIPEIQPTFQVQVSELFA